MKTKLVKFSTFSCMLAVLAMAMVGCEPKNPVENNQDNGDETEKDTVPVEVIDNSTLHHVYSVYNGSNTYGVPFHEFYSIFTTGTVKMNGNNQIVSGKGYVLVISLLSDPQDEATFPQIGNYNVSPTNAINSNNYNGTLVGGFETQNGGTYGCVVYMINDGNIEGYDLIATGTLQLKGSREEANVEARFMSLDSTYKFTYKGALEYTDNGFCEAETYNSEPTTPEKIDTISDISYIFEARYQTTKDLDEVVIRLIGHVNGWKDDYVTYIHILVSNKDSVLNGTYNVQSINSSADIVQNVIVGPMGSSYRMTHLTKVYKNLILGTYDAAYYIESGSMTATPNGFVLTMGSHYGSQFIYKYVGDTKIIAEESSAPERIAPVPRNMQDGPVTINPNVSVKNSIL